MKSGCLWEQHEVRLIVQYVANSYTITGRDNPEGSRRLRLTGISRQLAHEGGKVVSPTHRPPLPQDIPLWYKTGLAHRSC